MLAVPASLLNVDIVFLDSDEQAPAKQVISSPIGHIHGSFSDPDKIRELAAKVDVLTIEIEHVDVAVLEELERTSQVEIHPSPKTIKIIQDKYVQKSHLSAHQLPVAEYLEVDSSVEGIQDVSTKLGLPMMLKSKTMAYDGRGNFVLRDLSQSKEAIEALGNRPLYAERMVSLAKEIAVMVVRTTSGEVVPYPAVETVHKDNICHLVYAPLRYPNPIVSARAQKLAEEAVKTLHGAGVFGVEMFLLEDGNYKYSHVFSTLSDLAFT